MTTLMMKTSFRHFLMRVVRKHYLINRQQRGQAMLLILMYIVRAGLSWIQLDRLFSLINARFGSDILPRFKYMFRKIWRKRQEHVLQLHYFSTTCFSHLGDRAGMAKGCKFMCTFCSTDYMQVRLLSSGSFFVMLDVKKSL